MNRRHGQVVDPLFEVRDVILDPNVVDHGCQLLIWPPLLEIVVEGGGY